MGKQHPHRPTESRWQVHIIQKFRLSNGSNPLKHRKTMTSQLQFTLIMLRLYIKSSSIPPPYTLSLSLSQTQTQTHRRMKKINLMLRKCKTLSRQLGRSSSYSSLRSKSSREGSWLNNDDITDEPRETIFVGKSRRRYVISSKYLNHPLLSALIDKSKQSPGGDISIMCEVVLFDHLLWMLENGDPNLNCDSFEELADLYVF